jgi:hypothetical protein
VLVPPYRFQCFDLAHSFLGLGHSAIPGLSTGFRILGTSDAALTHPCDVASVFPLLAYCLFVSTESVIRAVLFYTESVTEGTNKHIKPVVAFQVDSVSISGRWLRLDDCLWTHHIRWWPWNHHPSLNLRFRGRICPSSSTSPFGWFNFYRIPVSSLHVACICLYSLLHVLCTGFQSLVASATNYRKQTNSEIQSGFSFMMIFFHYQEWVKI